MKAGDKLKIITPPHRKQKKPTIVIGEIVQIDKFKVTIVRIYNNVKTFNISFNIADFKDKNKKFYLLNNEEWTPIRINITEPKGV